MPMKYRVISGLLIALTALALWRTLSQSDERIIRKMLHGAVQALEKKGPESPITAIRRAERIAEIFVEQPDITIAELGGARWRSRSELRAAIFQARAATKQVSIRLRDLSVRVDPAGNQATLSGTAQIRAVGLSSPDTAREFSEFTSTWIKTADGWRLAAIQRVDAIRRPEAY